MNQALHYLWIVLAYLLASSGSPVFGDPVGNPVGCLAASSGGLFEEMHSQRMRPENVSCIRMLKEERQWQNRLGVTAKIFLCDVSNAFAVPDGDVYLGQPLIDEITVSSGPAFAFQAGGFIMSHEYCHQFQFRIFRERGEEVTGGPALELQADMLGAYWVGTRLKEQASSALYGEVEAISAIASKMAFDLGDYAFNSPQHHGTPEQRFRAVSIGLSAGFESRFGSPDEAFKDNAQRIFDWSAEKVTEIRHSE
jgi:hypothetical protein